MTKAAIIGASGYSGSELARLLLRHSKVKIEGLYANNSAGKKMSEIRGLFRGTLDTTLSAYSTEGVASSDIVFVALPSGDALNIVPPLLESGKKVIDLGGDFRLQETTSYEKYYKRKHTAIETLKSAIYGLPEINREKIRAAHFVSNPGCYPTSAILPLFPVLIADIIDPASIIVNSLSGVSGAGRSASLDLSFAEVNESVRAYKVGVHQHTPEIESVLSATTGRPVTVSFVAHLLPITRGIYSTIYATLKETVTPSDVASIFQSHFGAEPFIRIVTGSPPEIRDVLNTNFCDIGFYVDDRNKRLILMSVIDNLVKGAAGQALQNMNIMCGFAETEGLTIL